jgi:hypothetical protein
VAEKFLTLAQLQDELAKVLPERPCRRTIYTWMEGRANPMPYLPKPGGIGRWYRLQDVLAWLESSAKRRSA